MPLLGWPLLILLSVVLTAATLAGLLLWNRVRGPQAFRVLQRLAMLATMQVACTALVAAGVNNYGYFFGSWSDRFGGGGGVGRVQHVGGARGLTAGAGASYATTLGTASSLGQPDPSWSTPATYRSRGELVSTTLVGQRTGLSAPVDIYLPPQYFQPSYARTAFPALEILSGYPGSVAELVQSLKYPDVLLNEIRHRRAGPMVLVMLDPSVDMPRDTECTDIPGGPQVLSFLSEDVPNAVHGLVRVRSTRWGVMGHSTGGFCAAKIGVTHPDLFPAAVSMSGYYRASTDATTGDLFGGSRSLRDLNSPEWLLQHLPAPRLSMLLSIGGAEMGPLGLIDTHRFVSEVHSPMSADLVVVPHGAHNFADIRQVIPMAMQWMWTHLIA